MKKIKLVITLCVISSLIGISIISSKNATSTNELCLSDLVKINYSQAEEGGDDDEYELYSQSIIDILIEKITNTLK